MYLQQTPPTSHIVKTTCDNRQFKRFNRRRLSTRGRGGSPRGDSLQDLVRLRRRSRFVLIASAVTATATTIVLLLIAALAFLVIAQRHQVDKYVIDNRQSAIDKRQSAIGNRQATIDHRQSAIGNRMGPFSHRLQKVPEPPRKH